MPAPTPKNDQLRAMREAKAARTPVAAVLDKIAVAREAVNNVNNSVNKNAAKQAKWRAANPDVSRERVRNAMRKRRAEKA